MMSSTTLFCFFPLARRWRVFVAYLILRYIEHEDEQTPNTNAVISHAYVVRGSDDWVASILTQGSKFIFGVWDATEKAFFVVVP
ncbi:hypothetical protein B9Z55_000630 [Caenorhabditis nigoni]|uniref:Uncharacterized protein n=1 Tax=Caenorhabditis nigoni TaxID=1611254 RepID=A0A2G5VU33_9PELO|nr:hypothetical protein B9Z55_000630 [Caenorhabditis nigoni]